MANFAIFACGTIGVACVKMFSGCPENLKCVVIHHDDFWDCNERIKDAVNELNETGGKIDVEFENRAYDEEYLKSKSLDLIIMAYWGELVREPILSLPKKGILNIHTGFLPYGKGKHPHAWSIIDETPYGVTIHFIKEELDAGPIVFQKQIPVTWEDTGESLYFKGLKAAEELLNDNRDKILALDLASTEQSQTGTFHYGRELQEISNIDLRKKYVAKDLLNILRAKTFSPFPATRFTDEGGCYEVRVSITKLITESPKYLYKEIIKKL